MAPLAKGLSPVAGTAGGCLGGLGPGPGLRAVGGLGASGAAHCGHVGRGGSFTQLGAALAGLAGVDDGCSTRRGLGPVGHHPGRVLVVVCRGGLALVGRGRRRWCAEERRCRRSPCGVWNAAGVRLGPACRSVRCTGLGAGCTHPVHHGHRPGAFGCGLLRATVGGRGDGQPVGPALDHPAAHAAVHAGLGVASPVEPAAVGGGPAAGPDVGPGGGAGRRGVGGGRQPLGIGAGLVRCSLGPDEPALAPAPVRPAVYGAAVDATATAAAARAIRIVGAGCGAGLGRAGAHAAPRAVGGCRAGLGRGPGCGGARRGAGAAAFGSASPGHPGGHPPRPGPCGRCSLGSALDGGGPNTVQPGTLAPAAAVSRGARTLPARAVLVVGWCARAGAASLRDRRGGGQAQLGQLRAAHRGWAGPLGLDHRRRRTRPGSGAGSGTAERTTVSRTAAQRSAGGAPSRQPHLVH